MHLRSSLRKQTIACRCGPGKRRGHAAPGRGCATVTARVSRPGGGGLRPRPRRANRLLAFSVFVGTGGVSVWSYFLGSPQESSKEGRRRRLDDPSFVRARQGRLRCSPPAGAPSPPARPLPNASHSASHKAGYGIRHAANGTNDKRRTMSGRCRWPRPWPCRGSGRGSGRSSGSGRGRGRTPALRLAE